MSIQYLNTRTQMKIRPVSDEDVLFEMESNEFMTTCCRVDTSYDLVVRDITSGAMLFCISGAEIEDHPLDVYISDNHHIGRIEGMDIYVHGQNSHTVKVQRHDTQYTIQGSTVIITVGLVTLNWSTDFSVELKALFIAFALNIAMTKHKGTVIDDAVIRSTTPVDVKYPSLLLSTQSEACPRNNKQTFPSIFESCDGEQEFWMMGVNRWFYQCSSFLLDKNTKRAIAYITCEAKLVAGVREKFITALNPDRREIFTATLTKKHIEVKKINVKFQGQDVGEILVDGSLKSCTICCYEKESVKEIYLNTGKSPEGGYRFFTDNRNRVFGALSEEIPLALEIKLSAGISSNARKLIICVAFTFCDSWLQMFNNLPVIRISRMICNCSHCQNPYPRFELSVNKFLFSYDELVAKLAGHNRLQNVTYINIYCKATMKFVHVTLEITPIKDFQGIAKVEGKIGNGSTIFTALHYEIEDVFTIHDHTGQLTAYIAGDCIYDKYQQLIFNVRQCQGKVNFDEKKFGPRIAFYINDFSGRAISSISSKYCTLSIFRPRRSELTPSLFHLYIELTVVAKLYFYKYHFDRIPTPEIVYCYYSPESLRAKDF